MTEELHELLKELKDNPIYCTEFIDIEEPTTKEIDRRLKLLDEVEQDLRARQSIDPFYFAWVDDLFGEE